MSKYAEVIRRNSKNPIITANDIPYSVNTVFNAGAARVDGETLLLMRVEDRRGISHLTIARSPNGEDGWRIDETPALTPEPEEFPEELWGIEDPRIVRIDELDRWAITYTAYSQAGPLVSLATTKDFKNFERRGPIMPPEDKDAAIFPVRFNGRWAMIHRPATSFSLLGAHMWLSFSPDLRHWGDHQILMRARVGGLWDANKIGLSPPPLRTDEGWLIMYHGVKMTAAGCIYRLGLALLDLDDPRRVIARGDDWIFSPRESYELFGDVNKVVFPCGWVASGDDLKIYYGGGDSCLALAEAKISELLEWLAAQRR